MCFFAISLSVIGSLYQGKIRSVLFPEVPGDLIILTVELEANAPLSLIQQSMDKAESVKADINKKYQQQLRTIRHRRDLSSRRKKFNIYFLNLHCIFLD